MKKIFVMGAFFGTGKDDIESYSKIKNTLLSKFKDAQIIEPIDIENYQKNFLKNNKDSSFLQSITAMVNYDLNFVKEADLLLVNLSNKSFGVGMELGIAKEYNKKVLFVAKQGTKISNMVLGGFPNAKVNFYSTQNELIKIIENIKL